ncbi:hypothetical protein TRFO_08498 [Tritrichomonas foetus]|uniref:Uncharacterized protein n=1 Tax=Tritrichomonas foetus TaxID=1144522 RepID=A0A1J4JJB5_9EUKA|nr:hypothetical protein TRFO_08498 [Tritrichomonas foetus]|eukprot:OHS99250.1 hypothetical protein TRFO_08498 [Tritrichomonas foetus]
MYVHNDDVLFDPLPQPYRFVNKILLRCIEDAIDLAEGGGSAESLHSIVSHNLRLTKVGKIPVTQMNEFFLSTVIANHEVTSFLLLGETQYIVCGTSQGLIAICDPVEKSIVYSINVTTLSKFAQPRPINHLICFQTDHSNYVVAFATEDVGYLLFISSSFVLRSSIELDISGFNYDSFELKQCSEPYIVLTDGTGRTSVYNCHTPNELITAENSTSNPSKPAQAKPVQLDPIIEIEKCPISTGPVSSEAQLATKTEEPGNRKRPPKKKAPPPPKGRARAKSPGTQTIENATPVETTQYQATVYVFDQNAVIRFGSFPLLLLYKLTPPSQLVCEFPIPSPVSAALEVVEGQHIIFGFENGSFCFLNVARKTLHDHQFPKQGAIKELNIHDNLLFTFTETKMVSVYKLENFKVVENILTCSDDEILNTHNLQGNIMTYNQKSSDINMVHALTNNITWEEREIALFPNCSIIKPLESRYFGTISTPTNLKLIKTLWNQYWAVFIYDDPVEYRQATPNRGVSPIHGKRGTSPKITKPVPGGSKKGKVGARASKKSEDSKEAEAEATIVIKRQIIGYISLENALQYFEKTHILMEKEKNQRRDMVKKSSRSYNPEEEKEDSSQLSQRSNSQISQSTEIENNDDLVQTQEEE